MMFWLGFGVGGLLIIVLIPFVILLFQLVPYKFWLSLFYLKYFFFGDKALEEGERSLPCRKCGTYFKPFPHYKRFDLDCKKCDSTSKVSRKPKEAKNK